MKILNCHINGFGCLIDTDFSFEEGLNTICRQNGFGKTTLAVFIKAMLYGLPATTKRDLKENERKHYKPWKSEAYGGALELEADGRLYRIERRFAAKEKDDTLTIYDLATGKATTALGDCPGETLFEVDADGFERSIYISQRAPHAKLNSPTIQSKLGALIEDSEDLGDFQEAHDLLLQRARSYQTTGERGSIYDLKREIAQKDAEIAQAEEAALSAEALRAEMRHLEEEKAQKQATLSATKEENARRSQENEAIRRKAEAKAYLARLETAVSTDKEREGALLTALGGEAPTQEALTEIEEALTAYEAAEAALAAISLSEDKRAEKERLKEKHRENPISDAIVISFRETLQLIEQKERKLALSAPKAIAELDSDAVRYRDMTPEVRTEIVRLLNASSTEEEKKKLSPLSLVGLIGACLSFFLSIAFFLLNLTLPALLMLAPLALFAALAAIGFTRSNAASGVSKEALRKLLLPFGIPPIATEVRVFLHDYDRFVKNCETYKRDLANYEREKATIEAEKAAFAQTLAPYGNGTPEEILEALRRDLDAMKRFSDEEAAIDARKEAAEATFSLQRNRLALLLAPYPIGSLSYRQLYRELNTQSALLAEAKRQLEADSRALSDFRAQTGFDGQEEAREELPYLEEGPILSAIDELTSAIAAKDKEAAFLDEKACLLQIRIEEKAALTEALAEEEATYSALEAARKLLSEAKESLSTRYLSGMEQSFSIRMAHLDPEALPYHFDTELSLSAEKEGARRQMELFSAGESDLALFCARIALVDTIFKKEMPVLILDDPFVNLDEENLARANALLATLAEEMQILYFACRKA